MRILRTTVWTAAVLLGLALVAAPATADFVINDDLIVDGSACIGLDCVNGESFGFDTLRLKENNLRIRFFDTSTSASFPTRDWEITVNDSSNGGAEKFSITDIDGGRVPFTIQAGAPSNSLFVNSSGRLGLGTGSPVVEVHIVDGDTPTLRLEQDGSSGFTPQTWDVAGNETNFFVRDATTGSRLPFRIRPAAPSNSLYVNTNGDVGMGTSSPAAPLDVVETAGAFSSVFRMSNNSDLGFRLINTATSSTCGSNCIDFNNAGGEFRININDGDGPELTLNAAGNLVVTGSVTTATQTLPDYVFEPDYELMPLKDLAAFIEREKHLPNVPSKSEVEKNGGMVNMTGLQMSLLEKIEELTLYTLAQQSEIEVLRERLAALEGARSLAN